jgi:hypothetical protein
LVRAVSQGAFFGACKKCVPAHSLQINALATPSGLARFLLIDASQHKNARPTTHLTG